MLKDCPKPEKIYSQQFFGQVESLLSVLKIFHRVKISQQRC